jgi:aldehyde:ferredoxin oxidoreductase
MYGNNGTILKVNLSTGEVSEEQFDREFYLHYLGGNGLIAKLISDNVSPSVAPLEPENAIVFAVGPLTDTPVWGTSRGHVGTISPQTGFFCDSNYGGDFGMALKRTGYDAVYITGKSPKPVYLSVTEGRGELKDAAVYWGKTTEETLDALEALAGKGAVASAIGPAGEEGIIFANIICGGKRRGAAGRGGMGAVLGSKNLKAIVAEGSRKTQIADSEGLKTILRELLPELKENRGAFTKTGTSAVTAMVNSKGMLGTHNNTRETFEYAEDISGDHFLKTYKEKNTACHGCVIACGKKVGVTEGDFAGTSVKMPEYETLYAMGSMLDNHDINSIFNANHICDLMGIDTISMGVTLAFVAECMERGIVTEDEVEGRVNFDDGAGMVELIKKTARKEGIGKHLALGSLRLANLIGKESYKYLNAVQGLECAGHSARGLRGMALAYSTSTRGGSHHDARPNYPKHSHPDPGFEAIPEYVAESQYFTALGDSLVICRFIAEGMMEPSVVGETMVKILNCVTGWNIGIDDVRKIGERIYNLERLINVKRGLSHKDDVLPYRVMNEPIPEGPAKGRYVPREELDRMLDRYYELRGWSAEGIPMDDKLEELGLK